MLKDKSLVVWSVLHGICRIDAYSMGSEIHTYHFTSWDRVIASVEGAIKTYMQDTGADALVDELYLKLSEFLHREDAKNSFAVPIQFGSVSMLIIRSEFDHIFPVASALIESYEKLSDPVLKSRIASLFT